MELLFFTVLAFPNADNTIEKSTTNSSSTISTQASSSTANVTSPCFSNCQNLWPVMGSHKKKDVCSSSFDSCIGVGVALRCYLDLTPYHYFWVLTHVSCIIFRETSKGNIILQNWQWGWTLRIRKQHKYLVFVQINWYIICIPFYIHNFRIQTSSIKNLHQFSKW